MTPQTPSRRAIVKGAAWSAPVVTIAAAAPSLAASSTPPNLSGSIQGTGSGRTSATVLRIEPATLVNSGGTPAEGVQITMTSSGPAITNFQLAMGALVVTPGQVGGSISGLDTQTIVVTIPASLATVPANDQWTSTAAQLVTFADGAATTLTVVVHPLNDLANGVPFAPPPTDVPVYAG